MTLNTFTRSYWHDLCRDRIGRDIHHHPSPADAESRASDLSGYLNTLELYRTTFGIEPSGDCWPQPQVCRGRGRNRRLWLPLIGSTALLTACSTLSDVDDATIFSSFVLLAVLLVFLSGLRSGTDRKEGKRKTRKSGSGAAAGNCSNSASCSSCGGGGD